MKRLTVNLTNRGEEALNDAVEMSGDNATDCINHALILYAWFLEQQDGNFVVTVNDKVVKFL